MEIYLNKLQLKSGNWKKHQKNKSKHKNSKEDK